MAARMKARRLGDGGQVGEAPGDGRGPVGVAAEDHGVAARLVPPPHDHARERHHGVDLQGPAGPGQRGQHGPVLVLEHGRIERVGPLRPVAQRIVDVREHRERRGRFDQPERLAQVGADEIGGPGPVEEKVHRPDAVHVQRVQRPEDPVERPGTEHGLDRFAVPVRLAQFGPGKDAQHGEQVPAAPHAIQVAGGGQRRRAEPVIRPDPGRVPRPHPRLDLGVDHPSGEVGVVGEGDGRQAQFHRPGAGLLHRPGGEVAGQPDPGRHSATAARGGPPAQAATSTGRRQHRPPSEPPGRMPFVPHPSRGPFRGLPREVPILTAISFTVALGFGIVAPDIPAFARHFGGIIAAWSERAPFIIYGGMLIVPAVIAGTVLRNGSRQRAESTGRPRRAFAEIASALRDRAYRAAAFANLADGFGTIGVRSAIIPLFVRDILHRSAIWTGAGFLLVAVINAATLLPAGRLADRFGRRPVIVSGCLVAAAGMVLLALVPGVGGYLAGLAILGLGSGFLDVGPAAMLGDILKGQGGTVVATYQMAGDVGAVTGPVTAGYLVDVASYGMAFGVTAGVLGLAAVLALFAPETRWRDRPIGPDLVAEPSS